MLIIFVPFSLDINNSISYKSTSVGSGLNGRSERSSLPSIGNTSNSDLIVASRVQSIDGEGFGVGVKIDPDTSGVDLVRHLPGSVTIVFPSEGNGIGSLSGNSKISWFGGWSSSRGRRRLGHRGDENTSWSIRHRQESSTENDVGLGLGLTRKNGRWGSVCWAHCSGSRGCRSSSRS